jgi:hypothetical protein
VKKGGLRYVTREEKRSHAKTRISGDLSSNKFIVDSVDTVELLKGISASVFECCLFQTVVRHQVSLISFHMLEPGNAHIEQS